MELDEVLSSLSDDQKTIITSAIESEKKRGIDEYRKVSGANKQLLSEREKLRNIAKSLEIDPDSEDALDKVSAIKDKISGKTVDPEIKKLMKRVEELSEYEAKNKKLAEKLMHKSASDALKALMKDKVHGEDFAIEYLISKGNVRQNEDEKIVWIDGDEEKDLNVGVESFLKSHPELLKNPLTKNSGGSSGQVDTGKKKTMPEGDWMKLPPRAQGEFIKSGGTIT